jgi:hypothetical protein
MNVDAFADRLAKVRHRFVSTIEGKIRDAFETVPRLAATAPAAAADVARCTVSSASGRRSGSLRPAMPPVKPKRFCVGRIATAVA